MGSGYVYKKAILHIDGDAFFASCEQATNTRLRGKPIAVGHERGVATAYSYEAKALGVTRGLKVKELKRDYPQVILVSSDYKKYSLFSSRFKEIVSRTCRKIEKTSIDECYADITGLDKKMQISYEQIALLIQSELRLALGMTFSIGLGPTKTLAKIGSGCNKPHGLTVITREYLEVNIYNLPIGRVPGIGHRTIPKMNRIGIETIGDFVKKDQSHIEHIFSKPYLELYKELIGESAKIFEVVQNAPKSISKIHAFEIPTAKTEYLLSELSRHSEVIARKLSFVKRGATRIRCGIKTFDEMTFSREYRLDVPICDPQKIFSIAKELLNEIQVFEKKYRATHLVVSGLQEKNSQASLFRESNQEQESTESLLKTIRSLEKKHGSGIVARASSGKNTRDRVARNANALIYSSDRKKVLPLIFLGVCT